MKNNDTKINLIMPNLSFLNKKSREHYTHDFYNQKKEVYLLIKICLLIATSSKELNFNI